MRLVQRFWQGLFWLALTAVAVFSLLPLGGTLAFAVSDKLQHLLAYAGLAALAATSYAGRQPVWLIGVGLLLFSGAIELLQGLSGYRYAEWLDLLANAVGVALGLAPAVLWRRFS